MKDHFNRTTFDLKSSIDSFSRFIPIFLILFCFMGISEMNAQTKSELGDATSQQVIQIIQDEMNRLEGSTRDINNYLVDAYSEAIDGFEEGGDILDEFSQIIENSDLLTQKLEAANSDDCADYVVNPAVSSDSDDLIGNFFNGIVIRTNYTSGVNEAISRINDLKNQ